MEPRSWGRKAESRLKQGKRGWEWSSSSALWISSEDDGTGDDLSMGLSPHGNFWLSQPGLEKHLLCTLWVPLLPLRWITADTTDSENGLHGHISLTRTAPQPRIPLKRQSTMPSDKWGVERGWIPNSYSQNQGPTQKWWKRSRSLYCCFLKAFFLEYGTVLIILRLSDRPSQLQTRTENSIFYF